MKFIKTWNFPGALNMALDVVLMEQCAEPILRFYTWARPTLSIGRHQKRINVNVQFMREKNIDCVIRPTGGRAVLHWDELTYSLILPIDHPKARGGVLETYLVISECIARALCALGFKAKIEPVKKFKESSTACFDSPSSYEITIDGKKIVGSAQMRNEKGVLQHGSILFKEHTEEYAKLLNIDQENLKDRMAGLSNYEKIRLEEVVESLQYQFETTFGEAEPFTLNQQIMETALKRKGEFLWLEN
ncbi:MAG: biotin/lipoate A/B protein ligase family protein [Pseudothermotoga sp.]